MMREKSESKSFLHHNFAAEGGNMQSKMTLAFTYMQRDMHDKAVKLYAELAETAVNSFLISKDSPVVEPTRIHSGTEENKGALGKSRGEEDEDFQILEYQAQKGNAAAMYKIGLFYYFGLRGLRCDHTKALHWFSKAVEKGEPRHKVKCNKHCFSRSLLCFWDSHNIKKNDEFMGISLLLLDEQQQLDLPSVSSLTLYKQLCGAAAEVFPELIPWKEEKKKFISIGELHTFIANSSEQTEEADFLCKAQIVGVVQQNGLSFVSCTGCNRKLAKSLWCNRCVSPNAPGSSAVDDGKESATFVVFEREMIKLIKKEAKSGSCVDTLVAVGGMELPKCLEELAGNGYLFSYVGVSGNSNKAPVVDLKSGQPTAFSSSAGDAAKIALGNDGANQSGSADCC
ncbi:hypothetical protein HID58_044028 [Brassica napus]|uniref:Uncharacterized protein n=1 Tax=Brassica napus TaxID=3708 RepID=A0ABQ8BJV9_BRANA|nr:hypothetical protein HID58_044028 [Brassica napus]